MRITCPGCDAVYDVPEALAGSGRKLRCARCGRSWSPAAAPAMADGQATTPAMAARQAAAPEHAALEQASRGSGQTATPAGASLPRPMVPEPPLGLPPLPAASRPESARWEELPLPMPEERPPTGTGVWLALGMSVVLLVAAAASLLVWRDELATQWPPIGRLYAALGLD
ncbi:zinc-ribbon domain-containing protein [Roseomonas sp. NAR14]|uniref:Zinc-ribbon domain-containing protein n=1 Tax=Roseomonas acroporae TaxID=2937791 RepID=A0A9X1YDN1_9PROT|nr:zinc-ribbon domain-containing protein [Roseomonas acroporae]MCK8787163.1 zinc-ribbon domain-containing protein [Roseomonas acroporae]